MSSSATTILTLVSEDRVNVLVDKDAISGRSSLISDLLADLDEAAAEYPIPISKVKGDILKKVVEWCEHHKDDASEPQNLAGKKVSTWDQEFFNNEDDVTFDIILAANFLEIKGLLHLGVKLVANQIRGLNAQQIREKFGLEDDLTPEEKDRIRRENAWADDL
ncbi:hypothetical protein HYFRA_00011032 [Hymenoscyphus fraxineus]|uniref:E3 ubiquitin ligase complex SCF subunit n=1 Tax=Hymenoscyphus fraxineus TaxID=746836 RepID=A0A9N9PWJ0_9HELO|nr:hypothetical protein HYFRA_00011032 [Hymenoscyphus fraxineus]